MVVVSRWFGGVLLGPDRFRLINNTARSLLSTCGYINGSGSSKKGDLHNKTTTKVINTASKKGLCSLAGIVHSLAWLIVVGTFFDTLLCIYR